MRRITDLHDSGDVARSSAALRHLHDALSGDVWQWTSVDERTAKLIHAAVTWPPHCIITGVVPQCLKSWLKSAWSKHDISMYPVSLCWQIGKAQAIVEQRMPISITILITILITNSITFQAHWNTPITQQFSAAPCCFTAVGLKGRSHYARIRVNTTVSVVIDRTHGNQFTLSPARTAALRTPCERRLTVSHCA